MNLPTAYSYQRFSDKKQAAGDSLRRQDDAARRWCERHGVHLDETLTFRDCGRSAFHGAHRKNPDLGGLAAFLRLVEQGRIPENSYLIIESLDRLSREAIKPALSLLLSLSDHVQIVQLQPAEAIYGKDVEPMQLMMAIMELSRGHSESAVKSVRVRANWDEVKRNGEPVPGRIPAWIQRVGNEYRLVPGADDAVRTVFTLARQGYGAARIARELLRRNIKAIGLSGRWNTSYVRQILDNPATYGVQQYSDGQTIPGYFPPVITEEEFYAAKAARRPGHRRRGGSQRIYLFNDKIRDALTGEGYHAHQHSANKKRVFVSAAYKMGRAGKIVSFPIEPFERALLQHLAEIDPRDIIHDDSREKLLALEGQLGAVEARIAELEAALEEGEVVAVARMLRKKEEEKTQLTSELTTARQEASSPRTEAWQTCQTLISMLDNAPDQTEARLRLHAAINRIVDKINVLFVGHGKWRLAFAQVHFADSHAFREIVICYHGAYNSLQGSRNGKRLLAVKPEKMYTDTWKTKPIPSNDIATYAEDVVAYLRETADDIDRHNGKRVAATRPA